MEKLFRQEVIDKKKHRLEGTISLVQPPVFKSLTLLILLVVIISLVFLSLGSYTRKEKVSGVLQPDTGIIKLGAPQSGIIAELMVQEGQLVKKNQPILRIISEQHGIDGVELNQSLINQFQFQLSSLTQQLSQQKIKNELQVEDLIHNRINVEKRLIQLGIQNDIFAKRIEINNDIVEQITSLADTGYISDLELKRQNDTLLSLKQQSSSIQSEKLTLQNQIEKIDNQQVQLPIEQEKATAQLNTQIKDIQVQLARIKQQRLSELRTPVDGVVSGLLAKVGKSVTSNQNLISILPEGSSMQAIIYVPTKAFGFIEKGQKTRLRYYAFPYEKFGIYEGIVDEISANVILPDETDTPGIISQPSYRIVIDLDNDSISAYGKEIPLRAGMRLDADIIIEERSLIHWLFDPVFSLEGRL
ncbi:MAG: HlyD family efflux transporter periplasmic adaptor subunit [Candidatus Nitrosopelagicus sp.]|nr:HlyD family efflux transporter periplasmic adaptor subunit [Candidatus Nitrosopelagicus sp.]